MDILASFGQGLLVVLEPEVLMYCFLGVFLGTFIGVLPGVGSMAAIAIILPLMFGISFQLPMVMLLWPPPRLPQPTPYLIALPTNKPVQNKAAGR